MKRFHLLALYLLLRGAITQTSLVLIRFGADYFEFVFLARSQERCSTIFARRLLAIALAFGAAFLDFRNVAERFDALGEFDKRTKICRAYHLALDDVVHFVRREEIRPDIVHLLQAQRQAAIFPVHFQNFRLNGIALLELFTRMLDALSPADVADVNQAFEPFIHFDECPEVSEATHAPADYGADRETLGRSLPWVRQSLL